MSNKRSLVMALIIIFVLNILIISIAQMTENANAAVYKQGSSGSMVSKIQTRLKNWGYYTGSVDGIYGSKTVAAVKYFQRKNGLSADGICGPQTLRALGLPTGESGGAGGGGGGGTSTTYSSDVNLLARLISAESRGEPYIGQVAVGAVVLNRVKHPSFPNTIAGVIYQNGAFTCLQDGEFQKPVVDSAYKAARDALNGWDPTGGAIYYFNPATATSKWIWSRPHLLTIGRHIFCS